MNKSKISYGKKLLKLANELDSKLLRRDEVMTPVTQEHRLSIKTIEKREFGTFTVSVMLLTTIMRLHHTGPTQQDFTALTQTMTAAINQVARNDYPLLINPPNKMSSLAATAVDAKFDMLRSAIKEATDHQLLS